MTTFNQQAARLANTMARAVRGAAPKYRGRHHKTLHSHVRSFERGEYTSCVEYLAPHKGKPLAITTTPYRGGWLAYTNPLS